MAVNVTYTDRGLTDLGKTFREFEGLRVRVGVLGGRYEDGTSVAQVALYQEFGTETIPARSFLRRPLYANRRGVAAAMSRLLTSAVRGQTSAVSALVESGRFGALLIKSAIRSGNFRPLAPSTVQKKGHSRPLIDTGKLLDSIGYRVEKNGAPVREGMPD